MFNKILNIIENTILIILGFFALMVFLASLYKLIWGLP